MNTTTMMPRAVACERDADLQRLGCSGIAPETLAEIPDPERIFPCAEFLARLEDAWQAANGESARARARCSPCSSRR
jgi:hypothetical protein